jgi:hypothetical protein
MESANHITGNIFLFHAFDVGEEIDLDEIIRDHKVALLKQPLAKYFKNYHIPLSVEHASCAPHCEQAKLHNFGVITLRYRIPFATTLEDLRKTVMQVEDDYTAYSLQDAGKLFQQITPYIKHARFFHIRSSYVLIQISSLPQYRGIEQIKQEYGDTIASLLRFETEILSEHQKNEILESAFSYYQKDFLIIDTHVALIWDEEYEEILDLFEFANMQHLELQYFDRLLDTQLSIAYEQEKKSPPITAYLPFVGGLVSDPVGDLNKLKVDISVITDRLENSIKITGEAYFSILYRMLSQKLDLANWRESINEKLAIIHDIGSMYQHKLEVIREDLLTCSIIVLIILELLMGLVNLYHR